MLNKSLLDAIFLAPWWTRGTELNSAKLNMSRSLALVSTTAEWLMFIALHSLCLQNQVVLCSMQTLNDSWPC